MTSELVQYAALPWRTRERGLEILLITTLNSKRWIIPKGWPVEGLAPHESAAHEAMEEAGVSGRIEAEAAGRFRYEKLRKNGDRVFCAVDVFPLRVELQRRSWMEKGTRELCWCPVANALERISEAGLREIVSAFSARRIDLVAASGATKPVRRRL